LSGPAFFIGSRTGGFPGARRHGTGLPQPTPAS
jgi:hypothetical protein